MVASFLQSIRSTLPGLNRSYNWLPQSPIRSTYDDYDVEEAASTSSSDTIVEPPTGKRPVLTALLQLAALFIVGSVVMGGTLWLALPPLDE